MKRSMLRFLWVLGTIILMSLVQSLVDPTNDPNNKTLGYYFILVIASSVILFKKVAGPKQNRLIHFGKKIPNAFDEYIPKTAVIPQVVVKAPVPAHESYEAYKGRLGENEIAIELSKIKYPVRILRNMLLGTDTQTHEIDMICITQVGIYVIESKNYGGWIFGNSDHKNWTQTFPNQTKNQFYNPIMQNAGHITHLEKVIKKFGFIDLYSVVVFSDNATLKSVPRSTNGIMVLNTGELAEMINASIAYNQKLARGPIMPFDQVELIWNDLYQYSVQTQSDKENHLNNVKAFQKS